MPRFRRTRRGIAVLLLGLFLPACTHYVTPKGVTPAQFVTAEQPRQVRVTLTDGTRQTLLRPSVSQDSLRGHVPIRDGQALLLGEAWSVPLALVQGLEVRRANTWGTVGLVVGGVLVVAGVAAAIVIHEIIENSS